MVKGLLLVVSLLMIAALAMVGCVAHTRENGNAEGNENMKWPKITYDISHSYKISSLEEASKLVGWDVPVPVPTYLPEGCEIREVIAKGSRVYIVISDEEIEWSGEEFRAVMVIQVFWTSQGLPGLKLIENPVNRGDHYDLWWHGPSSPPPASYELVLSASKDIPKEELFKVRDSMQY
jgi:hypothetical protein